MRKINKSATISRFKRLQNSIWLFPAVLTVVLLILTAFRISGTSIGSYNAFFNGAKPDSSLLFGRPRSIRSDEWLVNTQMLMAQKNSGFNRVNTNIGDGQDMSLILDVPYKEWSVIFKPHDLIFFVLPFENAFAFKWWLMGYLLILSCYFFIISLMPQRKLLAVLVSVGLLFSPFIQWWYQESTLGALYCSFFSAVIAMKLLNEKSRAHRTLWGAALVYVLVCFALILYPPFQIPCAIALAAFTAGYFIEKLSSNDKKELWLRARVIVATLMLAGLITLVFAHTRQDVINTIRSTAYPGKRQQKSGGFDAPHLLSGNLGAQMQQGSKAMHYELPVNGLTNQSESSNFIFLFPFLTIPSIYLLYRQRKKKIPFSWAQLAVSGLILFFLLWLFLRGIDFIGRVTLLELVPHQRLLIGLGMLSVLQTVLFIRDYGKIKKFIFSRKASIPYALAILTAEILLGMYTKGRMPGFIDTFRVLVLSFPLPILIYLLLRKHFEWAMAILAGFCVASSVLIHPVYVGTGVVSNTPLSKSIRSIASKDDGVWATEEFMLENFAALNGARSLSGVYTYPQLQIWREVDPNAPEDTYNRYAHTNFKFDRNPSQDIPTSLSLPGGDHLVVDSEPCSQFLKDNDVRYLLVEKPLNVTDNCASLLEEIEYPAQTFYIYELVVR